MTADLDRAGGDLRHLLEAVAPVYDSYSRTLSLHSDEIGDYRVQVHCDALSRFVAADYSATDLVSVAQLTSRATAIDVTDYAHGSFVSAAETDSGRAMRTNYDAVWMRDTLWAFLRLRADPSRSDDAVRVLLTQLDYLASQREKLAGAVENPELVRRSGDAGDAEAVHVRFDPRSPDFADVMVEGCPQPWTHKQNDALGLLLDTTCDAVLGGDLDFALLQDNGRLDALVSLVTYFGAIRYHSMEDSGCWEEAPRLNVSSISLVVSGLERIHLLAERYPEVGGRLAATIHESELAKMINRGYGAIFAGLEAGGESARYPTEDRRYRTADAALLNLIYPARLARLPLAAKTRIVELVGSLVRDHGVIRYHGDTYQSANFWFNAIKTDTSAESNRKREDLHIAGTEAEWFFDSWLAMAHLMLYRETTSSFHLGYVAKHTARAIGQITPEKDSPHMLAADGALVAPFSLPESYNHLRLNGSDFVLPSPITPLNWSKAMLGLLLHEYSLTMCAEEEG